MCGCVCPHSLCKLQLLCPVLTAVSNQVLLGMCICVCRTTGHGGTHSQPDISSVNFPHQNFVLLIALCCPPRDPSIIMAYECLETSNTEPRQ